MGQGLSICNRIISDHGGRVEVRSEPGQFTEFILNSPSAESPDLTDPVPQQHKPSHAKPIRPQKYAVLYVDDEEKAFEMLRGSFGDEFHILTTNGADAGFKLIEEHGDDIGVLLSDPRMPGQTGVQLLEKTRHLRPRLVRMMVTAYADYSATVDAVNLGNIFRYISKPIQIEDMRNTLERAMEFYVLQQERDDLLREKLSTLQNVLIADRVLGLGVAAGTLASQLRQPLRGLHSFLEIIPGRGGRPVFDLDRLRQGTFWRDFHGHVAQRSGLLADSLAEALAPHPVVKKSRFRSDQSVTEAQKPRLPPKASQRRLGFTAFDGGEQGRFRKIAPTGASGRARTPRCGQESHAECRRGRGWQFDHRLGGR